MSQIFSEEGRVIPVTVIRSGPCFVTHVKTDEKDGYTAVQVGFQEKKKVVKPLLGHLKGRGLAYVREVRVSAEHAGAFTVGDTLEASMFELGDIVDVIGTSKGKGFQGVVKRHGCKGGPRSHGSMSGRVPGSIGSNTNPGRVLKGVKMPGQMGNSRATVQNLRVEKIDLEHHLLAVRGAVPGPDNGYIIIREALKKRRPRKWRMPEEGIEELKMAEKKQPVVKAKKAEAKKKAETAKTQAKKK